jgi:hypothetical protein
MINETHLVLLRQHDDHRQRAFVTVAIEYILHFCCERELLCCWGVVSEKRHRGLFIPQVFGEKRCSQIFQLPIFVYCDRRHLPLYSVNRCLVVELVLLWWNQNVYIVRNGFRKARDVEYANTASSVCITKLTDVACKESNVALIFARS